MTNRRVLLGLLSLGLGALALACGSTPEVAEPTIAVSAPTSTVAASSTSPLPVADTPTPAVPRVSDHTCPPVTGGAPPIEMHPEWANYSAEIAEYLSVGGSLEELKDELELLGDLSWEEKVGVSDIDVTGDGQPDVVVESLWFPPDEAVQGYAYVLTCEDGRYVVQTSVDFGMTASFADTSKNQSLGLRAAEDLTGDGVPELVFSFVETPEMLPVDDQSDYVRFFGVVGWDGADFAELLPEEVPGRPGVTVINGDATLTDTDGDGLKELVLRGGALRPGSGHPFVRVKTETWGWERSGFAFRCATFGTPTYRFQAVEDADAAMLCQDLDKALASYQAAIFDESLKTWVGDELGLVPAPEDERALLSAYSRYRIMLIHVVKGTGDAASVVYGTLTKDFPPGSAGDVYAELATVVWDEYLMSLDLSAGCGEAILHAEAEQLAPLADSYGYYSELYAAPEYLCPY